MTLQSSGSMTAAQIAAELRTSTPITISGSSSNIVNWLGERNGSSITIPTHLYSKAAVKLTDTVVSTSNQTGSATFTSVNFGPNFSGRRLFVASYVWATGEVNLDLNSGDVTLAGDADAGGADSGEFLSGGPTAACGIFRFPTSITATSGTVVLNWTGSNVASGAAIAVVSMANISGLEDTYFYTGSGSGISSNSTSVTAASNGVILQAVCRCNTNSISWTGATDELVDQTVDTNFRIGLAFGNRFSSGSKTIGFSSSGTTATGHMISSFN